MADMKNKNIQNNEDGKLDLPLFIGAIIILAAISVPLMVFPEQGMVVVTAIKDFIAVNFGNWYIWMTFGTVIVCLYLSFSKYGKMHLGDVGEKPPYSTFSWAAMLFCGGIGGTVIYWGFIEWVYYFQDPPLHIQTGTWAAAEISAALAPYHWGFMCWTIYIIGACACAYMIHIKKSSVFRISEACRGALGNKVDGVVGKLIDMGFMFGVIAGAAISFALGTPFISLLISTLTGIPDTIGLRIIVMIGIALIFGTTSFMGIEKGMKRISDGNVALTIVLLICVLLIGYPVFTMDMATTTLSNIFQHFVEYSGWMDPGNITNNYPENWTVFYWAYAFVWAPFYGLFFAKISKGRSMREMIGGTVLFGTLGCFSVFMILGCFGIKLHMDGVIDAATAMDTIGPTGTIMLILEQLPFTKIFCVVILVVMVLFSATTYDATSGVLASVSQTRLDKNGESKRWLRLLWAACLVALPVGFVLAGSPLSAIQSVIVIFALPCSVVCIILVISFFKMVKSDIAAKRYDLETGVYNENGIEKNDK